MKQTAVEWLENKCSEFETIYDSLPSGLYEYIQQAKELEKQQIFDAFNESRLTHPLIGFKHETFEEYYNETYKK